MVIALSIILCLVLAACPAAGQDNFGPGQLTAGDVDDGLNFDWYLNYKDRMVGQDSDTDAAVLPNPFLSDRIPIQVSDAQNEPFSCAQVQIQGKTLPTGTNGKVALFPIMDGLSDGPWEVQLQPPGGSCPDDCVTATIAAESSTTASAATNNVRGTENLQISNQVSSLPSKLDLALLVDTTGSMCDEIDYLKAELGQVLLESTSGIDVRLAYIAYKSEGDSYDVRVSPFGETPNFADELSTETCDGGGAGELVNRALENASQLEWRSGNVARLALIVGDEPPHGNLKDHMQQAFDAALDLRERGVRVYGLAASGTDSAAEYLFRLVSFITGARYLWLTDDSGIGNPHAEPKVLCYQVTHLDKLLYRVIRSELTGKRVEADPSDIIREVGQQENGVCLIDMNADGEGEDTSDTSDGVSAAQPMSSGTTPFRHSAGLLILPLLAGFFFLIL